MAKKESPKSSSSFSRFYLFLFILIVVGGGYLWKEQQAIENLKDNLLSYIDNRDILAFEVKHTPEQIIKAHYPELVSQDDASWQEPTLKYVPYFLLDVKYTEDLKSREGVLLWGLVDGEMVLNTTTWETTHGFKDCLECQATRNDFRIIQALARHPHPTSIDNLQKELQVERDTLNLWVENAKFKHLIVQNGPLLQLHFENPKLLVVPQTQINSQLVSTPSANTKKVSAVYNRNQILALVKAAFGEDVKVRSEQIVYLPVYNFKSTKQDQMYSADWNAVTGLQIYPYYMSSK